MKIRLTKKRLENLRLAITFDDILFEKHRRLMDGVYKASEKYISNRKKVNRVLKKTKDGNFIVQQILDVHVSDNGTEIIIK